MCLFHVYKRSKRLYPQIGQKKHQNAPKLTLNTNCFSPIATRWHISFSRIVFCSTIFFLTFLPSMCGWSRCLFMAIMLPNLVHKCNHWTQRTSKKSLLKREVNTRKKEQTEMEEKKSRWQFIQKKKECELTIAYKVYHTNSLTHIPCINSCDFGVHGGKYSVNCSPKKRFCGKKLRI